jgi:hypothetical protein
MMKNIIYAITIFCFTSYIMNAQEEFLLDHTIGSDYHRYEWEDYEKFEYTTDNNGNITEKVYFVLGSAGLEPQYKYEYIYDQDDNLLHETEYVMGPEEWAPYKRTSYEYYPNGNVSVKNLLSYVGVEWQETFRFLYNYDQDGNNTDIIESMKSGDEWQNIKRTINEFTDGMLTKSTYKEWYDEAWKNVELFEYTYNELNKKSRMDLYFWDEDAWDLVSKEVFEYDQKGLLAVESDFNIVEGEEAIVEKIEYMYFDNDSLKSRINTLYASERTDIHRTDFHYLPEENTRIEILMYQKYFEWIMNQKKVYVYNKEGNLKAEENYGWMENRWLDNWKRIINYDENGFIDVENSYLYESIGYGKSDSVKHYYKEGGLIDKQEFFRWEYGSWNKYKERHFTKYENNSVAEIITHFISSDQIVHSISEQYENDGEYLLSQEKIMTMKDGVWTDSLKYVYSYEDDKMDKWTMLEWDGSMWKYKKRNLYVYNADDRISYRKEQYSAGTDVWVDHIFNYYTYDENGMLTQILQEFSDRPDLQKKQEYSYDENGMISEIRYYEKYSEWTLSYTQFFDYDDNRRLQKEYEMSRLSQIYKQRDYYYDWVNSVKKFDSGSADISVFPNPFVSQINVTYHIEQGDTALIRIFDQQGVLVLAPRIENFNGQNTLTINTDFLSSGVYYMLLDIGGKSYMEKITKVD